MNLNALHNLNNVYYILDQLKKPTEMLYWASVYVAVYTLYFVSHRGC